MGDKEKIAEALILLHDLVEKVEEWNDMNQDTAHEGMRKALQNILDDLLSDFSRIKKTLED